MRFTQRNTIDKSEMDKRTRQDAAICALDLTLPFPVPAVAPFCLLHKTVFLLHGGRHQHGISMMILLGRRGQDLSKVQVARFGSYQTN